MHTHTHSEQELGKVDTFGWSYQSHTTVQNTRTTESAAGDHTGNTSVKIAELGSHLKWH